MKRIQRRKLGYESLEDRLMLAAVGPDCGPPADPALDYVTRKQTQQGKLTDQQAQQDKQAQSDKYETIEYEVIIDCWFGHGMTKDVLIDCWE